MIIDVRHNLRSIEARLLTLPDERQRAALRTMNRVMTTARKDAVSELQKLYGLKAGEIRKRVPVQKANRVNLTAAMTFSGRRIGVFDKFGMRVIRARRGRGFGVAFGRPPWRLETIDGETVTPEMLRRAFVNRSTKTGQAVVMTRTSAARESATVIVAPGLARAFDERGLDRFVEAAIHERWDVVFPQELRYEFLKSRGQL